MANSAFSQITIVNAVAADNDGNGHYDTVEIEFSIAVNDSEMETSAITDSDWQFSLDPEFSDILVPDNFNTDVSVIATDIDENDEYVRLTFSSSQFAASNGPVYYRYTNSGNDIHDITSTYVLADFFLKSATDKAPPVISSLVSDATSSGVLKVGESITFTIDFYDPEPDPNITLLPTQYNNELLNWNTTDGGDTYTGIYTVVEGNPNQSTALQLTNVSAEDKYGNVSSTFDGDDVVKTIDANSPTITSVELKDMSKKIGDEDTLHITISSDADNSYSLVSGTVAGYSISSIEKVNSTTIYAFFDITERDYDVDSSETIQVYNLRLADGAGNLSNEINTSVPNDNHAIFSKNPSAYISGNESVCHNDSTEVPIFLTGYPPYSITYEVNGANPVTIDPISSNPYMLKIIADHSIGDPLTYIITDITDATGNSTTGNGSFELDVDTLPQASFTTPLDDDVYDVSLDSVELIGNYSGGSYYGAGVFSNSNIFSPQMAGVDYHDLFYTYQDENGCSDSDTITVRVIEGGSITFTQGKNTYCSYLDTFSVSGYNNLGNPGSFSISPHVDLGLINIAIDTALVFPEILTPGSWTVNYTYAGGDTIKTTFTVEEVNPLVTFDPVADYCADYDIIEVEAKNLTPLGGTGHFSLSDASINLNPYNDGNNIYIKAGDLAPSTYTLEYYYQTINGCVSDTFDTWIINDTFVINPLPVVEILMDTLYNIDGGIELIKGTPGVPAGSFSPSFMDDNGDSTAIFDPLIAGLGKHKAYYTYTDLNTCTNTDSVEFTIDEADAQIFGLDQFNSNNQYCYFNGVKDTIWAVAANSDELPGTFSVDGNIITDIIGIDSVKIDPMVIGADDHIIRYSYTNGNVNYYIEESLNIDSIGDIYFTGLDDTYFEDDTQKVKLEGFYSGNSGIFHFSGNGISDNVPDEFGYFYPGEAGIGSHLITGLYIRNYSGCQKAYDETVIINKATNIEITINLYYMVYPNPVKDLLSVKLTTPLAYDLVVNLYNNMGIMVKSDKLLKNNTLKNLNTNDLPEGYYYLKIMNNDKVLGISKIIIAR